MTTESNQVKSLVRSEEKAVEYVPFGAQDKIKLTIGIVKNLCCTPTRSGKLCDDKQALKFIMLCSAQHLNPFAGDAFLIGYDGKTGPEFSLITAHQVFLKRAEVSPHYDGMQSGVIVKNKESGEVSEVEGDFFDKAFYDLLGGWAIVHHKQRKFPTKRRIRLERFNKGYAQWQDDPGGMICKCAEADALRSTFPTMLGALYTTGEVIELEAEPAATRISRLVATTESSEPAKDEGSGKQPEPEPESDKLTPQAELFKVVDNGGFTFDYFVRWANETGNVKDATSLASFDDIPAKDAERLLRAKSGLLKGLQAVKGAA